MVGEGTDVLDVVGVEVLDDDDVVGLGDGTPVDWGMLAAPAGISTILLVVEFRFD